MKIDTLNKAELAQYCQNLGIETDKLSKQKLIEAIEIYHKKEIQTAKKMLSRLNGEMPLLMVTISAKNIQE